MSVQGSEGRGDVPTKLEVARGDATLEAGFTEPRFDLLGNPADLLRDVFKRLQPHGPRLADVRVERGTGSVSDFHVSCYLFNYSMTIRIRVERVEIVCPDLRQEHLVRFKAVIVDTLEAVKDHLTDVAFRAFSLAVGLHGTLEGQAAREYLRQFVSNAPKDLGPPAGSGAVFYFGADADRLLSSLTVDMSAVVPDAVYVRTQAMWDATRVSIESLPVLADRFVRDGLGRLGLELPE